MLSVSLYSVEQDKSFAVTDGLAEVTEPVFDRSGKYLYFFGSTDAGPLLDWFAQSGSDMRETRNVYLAVLRKDLPSPLAKESDEEKESKGTDTTKDREDTDDKKPSEPKPDTSAQQPGSPSAPHGGGATDNAASKAADRRRSGSISRTSSSGSSTCPSRPPTSRTSRPAAPGRSISSARSDDKTSLQRFDLEKRKAETLVPDVADYRLSADAKKLLYKAKDSWFIVPTTKEIKPGDGKIAADSIEVKVDPRAEWNADLRRGLAHQSRLLLRPEHARRRLEGRAREVRGRSSPT